MNIKQTSNAGFLLSLDNTDILLDGVGERIAPYFETPIYIKEELLATPLDALVFTHYHGDHFDKSFAEAYKNREFGSVFCGPELSTPLVVKNLEIIPIKTRHIGKFVIDHSSYLIKGSKTILFLGDASPNEFKNREDLPEIDLVIAPFAYAITNAAISITNSLGAKNVIITHLPEQSLDEFEIRETVTKAVEQNNNWQTSEIGQSITIL